jgi:bis(5'-nucleosyl)-tetraphosphatase (symmetrical)
VTGLRRIFVGDVQGCRAELEALLEELRFDPAADRLCPVGDLVNRGPDSLGALRLLRDLEAQPVLGNHDLHLLRAAAGTRKPREEDTLEGVLGAEDRDELLAWLAAQPFARGWEDVLLVHAGLHPRWNAPLSVLAGLDPLVPHPDTDFCTRVRHCDPAGARPERDDPWPGVPFQPWFEVQPLRAQRVVFGHWAARGLVDLDGYLGLDTGCVWGGALTAWVAEEDRLVSVRARRAYQAVE